MAAGFPWTKGITADDKIINLRLIKGSDSASRIDNSLRILAGDGAKALNVLSKGDIVLQGIVDDLVTPKEVVDVSQLSRVAEVHIRTIRTRIAFNEHANTLVARRVNALVALEG